MYDYDRRAPTKIAVDLRSVLDRPAKADDALALAYQSLIAFKQGLDGMSEIPSHLQGVYKKVMNAVDTVTEARKDTYDLRMMARRIAN